MGFLPLCDVYNRLMQQLNLFLLLSLSHAGKFWNSVTITCYQPARWVQVITSGYCTAASCCPIDTCISYPSFCVEHDIVQQVQCRDIFIWRLSDKPHRNMTLIALYSAYMMCGISLHKHTLCVLSLIHI